MLGHLGNHLRDVISILLPQRVKVFSKLSAQFAPGKITCAERKPGLTWRAQFRLVSTKSLSLKECVIFVFTRRPDMNHKLMGL